MNSDPLIFQLCCFLAAKSCPTLCDHMDCNPPGSSVCRISHARILEWLPFPSPGDLLRPGIKSTSPSLAGGFFTTREAWSSDYLGFSLLFFFFFCKILAILAPHSPLQSSPSGLPERLPSKCKSSENPPNKTWISTFWFCFFPLNLFIFNWRLIIILCRFLPYINMNQS